MAKAIFLDRDGVLNVFRLGSYVNKPEDLEVFPFSGPAISIFNKLGYLVFVVTNQSGIAKGFFGLAELCDIHIKLSRNVEEYGGDIKRFYSCVHNIGDKMCKCRKPQPGMILEAAKTYDIDLSQSWFIGDSESDIEAAKNAGCPSIAVLSGFIDHEKIDAMERKPDAAFQNVLDFAEWLKRRDSGAIA